MGISRMAGRDTLILDVSLFWTWGFEYLDSSHGDDYVQLYLVNDARGDFSQGVCACVSSDCLWCLLGCKTILDNFLIGGDIRLDFGRV